MSAAQYASLVLRTPTLSKRAPSTRLRSAGRLETIAVAAGICLPVPLLAATGLSVPLPNVVERIAAALVPWAEPAALDAAELELASGTIVPTAAESVAVGVGPQAVGSVAAPETSGPVPAVRGGAKPDASAPATRRAPAAGETPNAPAPNAPTTPSATPASSPSAPAADAPAATPREPDTAPAATSAATPSNSTPPATTPSAPAPTAPAPAPAPAQTTPIEIQLPPTSVPVVDEVVNTVNTVVADPVGTVNTVVADPVGTLETTLPVLAPVTAPLKPLLPKLGGK